MKFLKIVVNEVQAPFERHNRCQARPAWIRSGRLSGYSQILYPEFMAITFEMTPDAEARLRRRAEEQGLGVGEYVATLVADREGTEPRGPEEVDAYVAKVNEVLKKLDELPRVNPVLSADDVIGYDRWGLPEG